MKDATLLTLAGYFALMSLFAIGGANSAVPEMHRLAVDVERWMTERQFMDMFAMAQVTPGPNVIIVTLIGYHVAGLLGAVVATAAMCGPTCVFAFSLGMHGSVSRMRRGEHASRPDCSRSRSASSRRAATWWPRSRCIMSWRRASPGHGGHVLRDEIKSMWIFAAAALLGLAGLL